VLELLDKGTSMAHARRALALVRKVGMNLGIYLITGIPGERWEDVEATADLIRTTRPHDVQVSPLALYPGTRLFDRYRQEGRISKDFLPGHWGRRDLRPGGRPHRKGPAPPGRGERTDPAPGGLHPAEFAEQKQWLGFCAVTNLLCGEAAEEAGRPWRRRPNTKRWSAWNRAIPGAS